MDIDNLLYHLRSFEVLKSIMAIRIYILIKLKINSSKFENSKIGNLDMEKCRGYHGDLCDNMIYMMLWCISDP